jgi:hypothetical protein
MATKILALARLATGITLAAAASAGETGAAAASAGETGAAAASAGETGAAAANAGETGAAAGPTAAPAEDPYFVALDEISVPIVDGDRVTGRLRFRAVIAARDDAGRERLNAEIPRLRSEALVAGLEFSRLRAAGLRPVDAQALADALSAALQPGNPDIGRVLLVKTAAEVA